MNSLSTLPPKAFTAPLFDAVQFSILGELGEEGDAEILMEVTTGFLEDADGALDRLYTAIENDDFPTAMREAHSLKGGFATFGLMRAHALAREIEQLADEQRGERLYELYREMVGCYAAGRRALEAHLAN